MAPFAQQRDGSFERDEFADFCHIDPVAIRIADLGGGTGDDDAARVGPSEDFKNRLFQGGAADDGVIEAHEDVFGTDLAVGDVVDVTGECGPL